MTLVIQDGHVRTRVAKPLRQPDASFLAEQLGAEGIDVLIETGPVVHVTALVPMSTWDEVHVLAEVFKRTDAPAAFHPAEVTR